MDISFWGAAKTVTGSCHLVEAGKARVLLDCGLFQGHDEGRNRQPFAFNPKEIDFVVLTHAHLDHCGQLPRLAREGFRGEVVCTPPTADLTRLILLDAAHLQEEEAERAARKASRGGRAAPGPLFDAGDVISVMDRFSHRVDFGQQLQLGPGLSVRLHDAGHILGSAVVELTAGDAKLAYTGDLGSWGRPLVRDPAPPPATDILISEGTYGDRPHRSFEASVDEFRSAVQKVLRRGGCVLIPSFALERTQEVLYVLFRFWQERELPQGVRIVLDTPLGSAITRVYGNYPHWFDEEGQRVFRGAETPFQFPPLTVTRSVDDSKQLNAVRGGHIIIAGSGMCTGGRMVHHLRHHLWRSEDGVVFVGYQAAGTLGRAIVDGAKHVHVLGDEVAVKADVWTINGFSAHADHDDLVRWISRAAARNVFLLHGEERALTALADALRPTDRVVHIPSPGDRVEVPGSGGQVGPPDRPK
ncbi:MAG: MBL fold metallo-hydrolase RNA specificity domain-containing protein [Candidatus Bipolaricaulaceae bacterium]